MLATLLPGLREVRTPLAAGYLWLIAIGLVLSGHVRAGDLPAQLRSFIDEHTSWHVVGFGAATTFAALLLGLLAEGVYDLGVRFAVRSALPADPMHGFLGWHRLLARFESTLARLRSGPTKSGIRSLNLASDAAVAAAVSELERSAADLADVVLALGFVRGRSDRLLTTDERRRFRAQLAKIPPEKIRELLRAWLVIRIIDQLDLLARRLVSDNPELYSDYDRLRSEAHFRTAITPPLALLIGALAVIWTPWIAIAFAALPVYVRQAIRKGDQASDLLIDALLVGKVEAPALLQLSRTVAQLARSPEG